MGPTIGSSLVRLGRRTSRSQISAASSIGTDAPRTLLEPGLVLAQVVEQQLGLALERDEPRQPLQLAGVEAAAGDGDPQPDACRPRSSARG